MITWRKELHFTCDTGLYNPNRHGELMLDQMDAKTKKGMFAVAKKMGWTWPTKNHCYCPYCSNNQKIQEPN